MWSGKKDLVVKWLANIKHISHIVCDIADFGITSKMWKDSQNSSNFIHFLFVFKTQGRPKVGGPISWGVFHMTKHFNGSHRKGHI